MAVALATSHVCLSGQVVPLLHKPANRRQCTRKTRALHNESSSSRSNPARKASVQEESLSATTEKPLQSQEKARILELEENKPRERALRGRAPHVSKDEKKLLGRRRLLSKGLLAAVCCPLCSQLQTASAAEWSYGGPSGPTGWGGFCAFGRQQSPVDVPVKGSQLKMDALGKLHFNYSAADVTVVNTGHGTMQVNFPAGNSSLRVGSRTFDLVQFHFHSPSEHAIDGERFDMEAHMVHKERETGLLAVVGTLIQGVPNAEAFPNPALAAALELAPNERGATRVAEICSPTCALVKVSAEDLLPPKDSYFHYQGSLTTPPCSEGVEWFLMAETLRIQDTQLVQFLRYMGTKNRALALNSRPLQPMKGREITRGPTREI